MCGPIERGSDLCPPPVFTVYASLVSTENVKMRGLSSSSSAGPRSPQTHFCMMLSNAYLASTMICRDSGPLVEGWMACSLCLPFQPMFEAGCVEVQHPLPSRTQAYQFEPEKGCLLFEIGKAALENRPLDIQKSISTNIRP